MDTTADPVRGGRTPLRWTIPAWLALVGTAFVWSLSFSRPRQLGWSPDARTTYFFASSGGHLVMARQSLVEAPRAVFKSDVTRFGALLVSMRDADGDEPTFTLVYDPYKYRDRLLGFGRTARESGFTVPGVGLFRQRANVYAIPYASFALMALIPLAASYIRRWRGLRRSARGACLQCGYDLRATP